jgi:hypothetical protein
MALPSVIFPVASLARIHMPGKHGRPRAIQFSGLRIFAADGSERAASGS